MAVRQGDPLSPLLVFLAEDILSRGLSNLVSDNKIKLIKVSKHMFFPSHTLYVDDILLFSKGCVSFLDAIVNPFGNYADCSGHACNSAKSIMYAGSMKNDKHCLLANIIGFKMGYFPFLLGCSNFKG